MNLVRFQKPAYAFNVNNLLYEMLREVERPVKAAHCASVPVNIEENEKGYVLNFVAPGFEKEQFSIKNSNGVLTVKGEKKADENNTNEIRRKEYFAADFERSFDLPDSVDSEKISAKYINGILVVELPKKEVQVVNNTHEITIQ
jgi:HSP20 family protein